MEQTKSKSYWIEREQRRVKTADIRSKKPLSQIRSETIATKQKMLDEINLFYSKYARENKMTMASAKQLLNKKELEGFYSKLRKLKDEFKETENPLLMRKINTLLNRSKIQRLEKLVVLVEGEIQALSTFQQTTIYDHMVNTSKFSYDDLAKTVAGAGVKSNMGFMSDNAIQRMLQFPLSGQSFSEDIWDNRDALANRLQKTITRGINQGSSYSRMAEELQTSITGNYTNMIRVVRTETHHAVQQANLTGYQKLNITKYEIVSVNDERSSDDYNDYNGDVYLIEDAIPGLNYPPFHPNCRCTTIPVFE